MNILENLPHELHWTVLKYIRHPIAEILRKESPCFKARQEWWDYYHNFDIKNSDDRWENRCYRCCLLRYNDIKDEIIIPNWYIKKN